MVAVALLLLSPLPLLLVDIMAMALPPPLLPPVVLLPSRFP